MVERKGGLGLVDNVIYRTVGGWKCVRIMIREDCVDGIMNWMGFKFVGGMI